jgi:hypothetical protein
VEAGLRRQGAQQCEEGADGYKVGAPGNSHFSISIANSESLRCRTAQD